MSKRAIVLTSVLAVLTALVAGAYLWVQATYVLPAASCGEWAMFGEPPGPPGPARCFAAAARTCAAAGIRVHWQGVEKGTDWVWVIRAGGTPGRCQATGYSQVRGIGLPDRVETTACRASVAGPGVAISCPPGLGLLMITPSRGAGS